MKKELNYSDEELRGYLNPATAEKAPDGFTERMMNHILMEPIPLVKKKVQKNSSPVPAISAAVTFALVLVTLIFDSERSYSSGLIWNKIINVIQSGIPDIDRGFSEITVSNIAVYIMSLSILLLIFDLVLAGYFRKKVN